MLISHAGVMSITVNRRLIATREATSVANSTPRIVQVNDNTNPTAHGFCGDKAHGGTAHGAG